MDKALTDEQKKRLSDLRTIWGAEYTDKYDAAAELLTLEKIENSFNVLANEYAGVLTPRLEMSLRDISVLRLKRDEAMAADDGMESKRYGEMIDKIMTAEGLKAGDAKPVENVRVDAVILALEDRGAAKNGQLISKPELIKLLKRDKGKHNTSLDVVDAIMMSIINTMRTNNGQEKLDYLPISAQIQDTYGELLPETSDTEKYLMNELGILPPKRETM
ncbi:MAG: hypothetical protein RR394_09720 [Oscillospiraceae bacterium]